jgi:hypothetical protein
MIRAGRPTPEEDEAMLLIELSDADTHLLRQILRNERKGLLMEIAHTDDRAFREDLRRRHERIETLAALLEGPPERADVPRPSAVT